MQGSVAPHNSHLSEAVLLAAGGDKRVHVPASLTREVIIQAYSQDPWFSSEDFNKLLGRTLKEDQGLYFQAGRLAVPASLQQAVIADCHAPPFVGHMGMHKTLDQIGYRFW